MEELLEDGNLGCGYEYVLTAQLQTSGGRFLVSLLEVNRIQKILAIRNLWKESINIWEEDLFKEAELAIESLDVSIQEPHQ